MSGPDYAGSTIDVALAFGVPPLTPDDGSARVTIFAPSGERIVDDAAMAYDSETSQFTYAWLSPSDGGDRTYTIEGVFTGLDGSVVVAQGSIELALRPFQTIADQPDGIPPASRHWISPWCDESDIPTGRLVDSNGEPLQDVQIGWMIAAATNLLFLAGGGSRGRFGRSIVRPSREVNLYGNQSYLYPYSSMSGYGSAWGFAQGWSWSAMGLGWWQSGQDLSQIVLSAPVRRINEILVDGTPLGPNDYSVYDRRLLVRNVDPSGATGAAWPWNQQLQLPVSSVGTWQIDYEWGSPPRAPDAARLACADLSVELALAFSGQDSTKLPARVTRVATQGVDAGVGDPIEYLKVMLTGLPLVDLWINEVNPSGRRRRSTFMSPEKVSKRTS